MSRRPVEELNIAIREHEKTHKKEPSLIMLNEHFVRANSFYFRTRLHTLCCGKGSLYSGIPAVVTASPMVEDFLICY